MAINPQTGLEEEVDPITGLPVVQPAAPAAPGAPDVKKYIMEKYGLGDKYSDEARQKLVDESTAKASGPDWLAGIAALGAGIQGKDAGAAGKAILDKQAADRNKPLAEFDKGRAQKIQDFELGRNATKAEREDRDDAQKQDLIKRESDPMSEESMVSKRLYEKMSGKPAPETMTAQQFKNFSPAMTKMYEIEQKKLDRQESRDERRFQAGIKMEEKQLVRDEKKKSALTEVEDRRKNIEDNLTLLEQQIKDKGTYEMFGSHNADLDRRVDMIATDMAKLADPNSVARPSEVEMFKKGLIQSGATNMKNSTALDILKNFRNEVNKRADTAYKVRGLENPGAAKQEETKVVGGKTYRKVPGGWEEVE